MTTVKKTRKTRSNPGENVLGMYLNEISHIPLLTREEESEIARAAVKGDVAARERLIKGNLRFVVNVAKKFQGQGLSLDDLISEGNIGLINAVERYDVDKGYHFISYAVWWIRQSILKALCEKSRLIRLPANRVNELMQIKKAQKILSERNGNEVEIRDIARALSMNAEQVDEIVSVSKEMVSLERSVSVRKGTVELGDLVEDNRYESPEEEAIQKSLQADIEKVLATLDSKEADIIRLRFGLGKKSSMSLKELGDSLNLTKERIRQIEEKALTRLKHPSRSARLEAYVA
jgi:RNA polymerase primary sigma factor